MPSILKRLFKSRDKPQNSVSQAPQFYMGPSTAGNMVNERSSMQTTAVYACVRIIAETVASLPLQAYRNVGDGKEKMTDHPLYRLGANSLTPNTVNDQTKELSPSRTLDTFSNVGTSSIWISICCAALAKST